MLKFRIRIVAFVLFKSNCFQFKGCKENVLKLIIRIQIIFKGNKIKKNQTFFHLNVSLNLIRELLLIVNLLIITNIKNNIIHTLFFVYILQY